MNPDKHSTPVIFRVERNTGRELTAVFPTLPADYNGAYMTCYAHVGQHSACSFDWYGKTRPAKPHEYAALAKELESLGYRLKVFQRINRNHRAAFAEQVRSIRKSVAS